MDKKIAEDFEKGLTEQQMQTLLSKEDMHERCPATHTFSEHEPLERKEPVH